VGNWGPPLHQERLLPPVGGYPPPQRVEQGLEVEVSPPLREPNEPASAGGQVGGVGGPGLLPHDRQRPVGVGVGEQAEGGGQRAGAIEHDAEGLGGALRERDVPHGELGVVRLRRPSSDQHSAVLVPPAVNEGASGLA
jgi:hypothetical protein